MSEAFNHLTDLFDASINWKKRLANEAPFFRTLWESHGVKTVLDVACGTGHHAAVFQSWGLAVEGADISPNMIARARELHGEPAGLRWAVRSYDQAPAEAFDAVVCIGNSLALAKDHAAACGALGTLFAAARRCLVVHVLNLWSLDDGPAVWQKCTRADLPAGPAHIIKGVHRTGNRAFIELLVTTLETPPQLHSEHVPLLALDPCDLEQTLRAAGAKAITLFGNYQNEPYSRASSVDLIAVAEK